MTGAARKRHDPRREATQLALIEAAESLFAEHGVEGVSIRQIGAAIGSANVNVVAYHFGGKDALIRAVYRHRLPDIDRRRRELLDAADTAGRGEDLATLLRVHYLPLYEQVDGAGRHSYARFLAGLERSGMIGTRGAVMAEFPESSRLHDRICSVLPASLGQYLPLRLRLVANLVCSALAVIDREVSDDPALAASHFENTLAMATAALAAPAPQASDRREDPA